ncbi:DUF294 nucleotidyltransferase-like domain-containing protein [Bowmanella denitrificans]|uniref:DUF294 nucleotidyltransferase-like domain-containing protein n=1 Tax=Bowmanella denitrificans TaxID=366582 RepID=A0ABP3H3H8_9ALTE
MTDSTLGFLRRCAPFDQLPEALLQYCQRHLSLHYLCQDNVLDVVPRDTPQLYIIKQGVFDLTGSNGQLIERLEPGDLFGYPSLMTKRAITNSLKVLQDGFLFALGQAEFDYLCQQDRQFADYFARALGDRLLTETRRDISTDWTQLAIADIIERPLISLDGQQSMADAALLMTEQKVSCLLICEQEDLVGIVTDRDIRSRVVAARQSFDLPVRQFMTSPVINIDSQAPLFDAMQLMTSHNVHHVAVVSGNRPLGVITATDLMRQQRSEPLFLINLIRKAESAEQLAAIAKQVPEHLNQFANRVVDVRLVGDMLATFTDAFNIQLIRLYLREQGPAPCAFVWLTFGSQARRDQSLSSDQDNGLLVDDSADDSAMQWFADMADFVCQGLAACGLSLCKGNIMASNPELRLPLGAWLKKFQHWTLEPEPQALLRSNIFFDRRMLYGDKRLFEQFDKQIAHLATNQIFLANLAANAADLAVPIGLFNRFRTHRIGEHREVLDIKKSAIAIINDIVRIHALHNEIRPCSTPQRLQVLADNPAMNNKDCLDLLAAWRFLVQLRLQHQLGQAEPDNLIAPDALDSLARRQLKTAFRLIKDAQEGLALKFSRGAF